MKTTTFKIEQCCTVCAFCDVSESDDALICLKSRETVDEQEWCEAFELSETLFEVCNFKPIFVG